MLRPVGQGRRIGGVLNPLGASAYLAGGDLSLESGGLRIEAFSDLICFAGKGCVGVVSSADQLGHT